MNSTDVSKKYNKLKKLLAVLKFAVLAGLIIGVPLYIYFGQHQLIEQMSSLENVKEFFSRYRTQSIFAYLAAQIVQIVICIIPGQWLQITAGLVWGFWLGYLWSIAGAAAGSFITYYLAKWLGQDAMHLFFGEKRVNSYVKRLNSKKAMIIVFLIFLIPGVPKDLCNYLAGISEMKIKPFMIISLIGRSPGMMGSLLIGKQLSTGSWMMAIIIAAIFVVLFILGVVFRERLMNWFDSTYDKLMK
ncbi:MAG: VTT domain-containing protein [Eubacteriaceae bacterium]|nr:VTT domain-containing protein [Eubacteriaceae bacterium]